MSQKKGQDPHQPPPEKKPARPESAETKPAAPAGASETGNLPPDLDDGPPPEPVDEVQAALFEAAKKGVATELDVDDLPEPLPDLDEGPPPTPVDEVQEAIFEALKKGAPTEVEFDRLPEPGATRPHKVIRFKAKPAPPPPAKAQTGPEPPAEPVPLPDFPEPGPAAATTTDFWLLLLLFLTFRGLTLFLLRPGGFIRDWSDFDTYFGIAALSDYSLFPFLDFWLEWPPLVPWLAVGAYRLSLLLPPWPDDPRLWFILILGGVFVLFEVGNFILIHRLARRLFQTPAVISRVLWLYAGLFPPVYAMLGFFDGIALFFLLLALELLLADRRFASAVAVGAGFMVKIIPALMLPVALRQLWHRYRQNRREAGIEAGLYSVIFGLSVLVLLGPFLIGGPQWVLASARSIAGRASWETVWAVLEGYFGFGVVLGDRLNPAETAFAVHPSTLPWWLITLAFAGIYGLVLTRPANYHRPRHLVAFGGLTVALFLLYTKGYSPQFLVYLLPFIVLLFPTGRGLVYALVLTGLNVLEQPVYFVLLPRAEWLLTFIVTARFLVVLLVGLEFALELWPDAQKWALPAGVRPQLPRVVGGLAVLALVVLAPLLTVAYSRQQLQNSPVSVFAGFMQTQTIDAAYTGPDSGPPRLLLSDQTTYRRIYPYLHRRFELYLTDGGSKGYKSAPTVDGLLQNRDAAWVLPSGPGRQTLHDAVNRRGRPVTTFDFEELGAVSLYSFRPNPAPFLAPARFVGGIELLTHRLAVRQGAVEVTLFWRAVDPQPQSYTVFTQLLDAEGRQVAGHDSIPANGAAPTDGWPVNRVQLDTHRINLPADLPPGEYAVIAGLYNRFNERLRAIDPDGFGYANRAVPLGKVRLP